MNRAKDWLAQAGHLLEEARWDMKGKFYDGACFSSQQAAEMAVKALCQEKKVEGWGHSITGLLEKLASSAAIPGAIVGAGKALDKFYISTRYPNGFESGAPKDYYTEKDAREAIEYAEKIINFCRKNISK